MSEREPIPQDEAEKPITPQIHGELNITPVVEGAVIPTHEQGEQSIDSEDGTKKSEEITEVRSEVEELSKISPSHTLTHNDLMGEFSDHELTGDGKIILTEQEVEAIQPQVARYEKKFFYSLPSILKGHPTAAKYDSHSANFSTRTFTVDTPDGKTIFGVNNSPGSFFHREIDALLKGITGMRMRKAPFWGWKDRFVKRSQIPVMEFDDPNTVLMPYIENVNALDAIRNNKEVTDFGASEWAKDIDLEKKYRLSQSIVAELDSLHQKGIAWAEPVLPNIIITKDEKVVFVDPENSYYRWVKPLEQKARDLRILLYSLAGSFAASEDVHDFTKLVDTSLASYTDSEVIGKMQQLSSKNPGFRESAELTGLCLINKADQAKLLDAVRAYGSTSSSRESTI